MQSPKRLLQLGAELFSAGGQRDVLTEDVEKPKVKIQC